MKSLYEQLGGTYHLGEDGTLLSGRLNAHARTELSTKQAAAQGFTEK